MVIVEPQLHDCCSNDGFVSLACGHSLPIMSATCKVKVKPGMPVKEDEVVSIKVNVLRDSGCSGVVVRHNLVPLAWTHLSTFRFYSDTLEPINQTWRQ